MIQEFRVDKYRLLFDLQPEEFKSDHNLLWYAQNRQLPEPEIIHVMRRALKARDCAVDAGANIGFFTVLMSKIVGEHGRVLAVEPDPRNLAKLRKNLDINSCVNVEVYPFGLTNKLWKPDSRLSLWESSDNGQTTVFAPEDAEPDAESDSSVEASTLDRVCLRLPKYPTLLKMDIEGSEVAALQGCTYDFPAIICEVNHGALQRAGSSARDLFTLVRERGYERYQLHASGAMPSRILSSQSIKTTRENANMLFARPGYVSETLWPEVEL